MFQALYKYRTYCVSCVKLIAVCLGVCPSEYEQYRGASRKATWLLFY